MAASAFQVIDVHRASEMIRTEKNIVVLDVRNDGEYFGQEGHIKGSLHIPIESLAGRVEELVPHKDKTVVAFCYAGQRSQMACQILARHGFVKLYNVMGGMMDWYDAGYEVERGTLPPYYV